MVYLEEMNLKYVQKELKKRLEYPYTWGRKQSDKWDEMTNFIYRTRTFEDLLKKTAHFSPELRNYAMNRWYNFWSAMAVQEIFAEHPAVIPNRNPYDKSVDFYLNGIPFDHKTSVFPRGFKGSLAFARQNKDVLIRWLYANQSAEGRRHFKNRLFVVLYDGRGKHWTLKAELLLLRRYIDEYMAKFDTNRLSELYFGNEMIYSDIIWVVKSD